MTATATFSFINVLDLGDRPATAWCSRLLADLGANVVTIEPDDGHPLRRHPPFDAEGTSTAARYFLANKSSAALADRPALIAAADVVVTSGRDGAALLEENPAAVVCAITAYGQDGERAELAGNDLTAYARSGWAYVNGLKSREPLKGSGYQASFQAGTLAFAAVAAALIERYAGACDGELEGQLVDIAELETLVSTSAPAPLRVQYSGFVWPRREKVDMNEGPVPVRDGFFALPLSRPAFWQKAMQIFGLPDLADDEELQQPGLRHKLKDRYVDRVHEKMLEWDRLALFEALAAERVIAGPVLGIDEMGDNPQLGARGFFATPNGGETRFPGPFARMGKSPWRLGREMGEAGADAGATLAVAEVEVTPRRAGSAGRGPLAGFRGLVLTQAWAGTYATELLALLGAEVIQLEVRNRLDSWRGSYQNPIPKSLEQVETAVHPWNCSPLYNSVNLNKKCITVDLSEPEGVAIFKGLVAHADFVAENFSPRVMGNLGIDYDKLIEIKPDLVMASLSAYGATGPWANVPGIGGTIEPSSGMSSLLGYEGEHPQNSGQMYPDPVAGLYGFGAIATALLHRDRTGEGQYIDLSMQEANFTFIGDAWLEYAATGRVRGPLGNRHPLHAPHGVYPAAGDDQWLAIAAETDAQWRTICELLNIDGGAWPDAAARKAAETEIDGLIAAATAAADKHTVADLLARAGVPAAPVLDSVEVVADEALRARGHMVRVDHPETGPMWQSGLPIRFSRTPGGVHSHAPLQGQHSLEVFSEFLGMTEANYERLVAAGITGKGQFKP